MTITLTFEEPPAKDDPRLPTRDEIAEALTANPGKSAIVGYHDRAARATGQAGRINDGSEYGKGFTAVVRRVGNQHRVYARKVKGNRSR